MLSNPLICELFQAEVVTLKNLVSSTNQQEEETRKALDENNKTQIEHLRREIRDKDEKLEGQEGQIKALIDQWEKETEVGKVERTLKIRTDKKILDALWII